MVRSPAPRVFVLLWLAACAQPEAKPGSASAPPADAGGARPSATTSSSRTAPARAPPLLAFAGEAAAGADAGSAAAPRYDGPRSPPLRRAGLWSPIPGGVLGGWGGDTGLDIAGDHLPVHAIAAGTLDYSEWGHTLWTRGRDTPYSVRIALDEPIPWGKRRITHVYYTHLSRVETVQPEGAELRKHVEAGERIGVSGIGNGVPHLHLGLLLDGEVEQDSWTFILREHEVRKVMGGYRNGERLPRR